MYEPRVDHSITLSDGRSMAYAEWGEPAGPVVVFIHGSPHSRMWCPDVAATEAAGCRLITIDRPGFGGSDPAPDGFTLRAWTADVEQFADALNLGPFAVVGWSSGALYATACAAVIPDRLTGAGVAAGAGGPYEQEPGRMEQLDEFERLTFRLAREDQAAARAAVTEHEAAWVAEAQGRPESVMDGYDGPPSDLASFADPAWSANFYAAVAESLRQGTVGTAWEWVIDIGDWGFVLEDITMDFYIWHGALDPYQSQSKVDYWSSRIPRAIATVWPDSGHFAVRDHWAEILLDLGCPPHR